MLRSSIVFFASFIFSTTALFAHLFDDKVEYREPIREQKIPKKELEKIIASGHNSNFSFKAETRNDIVITGYKIFTTRKSISKDLQYKIFKTLLLEVEPEERSLEITANEDSDKAEDFGYELNNYGFSITVLLPEKMNIECETHNGSVHVLGNNFISTDITTHNGGQKYKAKSIEKAEIETHNGSIKIEDASIPHATISTHNGKVRIRKTTFTEVSIDSHNGKVELDKTSFEKATIEGHNGDIVLEDTKGKITVEEHNGRFDATNVLFTGDSKIVSHNGDIEIEFDPKNELKITARTERGFPFENQDISKSFKIDDDKETFFIEFNKPTHILALSTDNGEITLKK